MRAGILLICLVATLLPLSGCASSGPWVEISGQRISVEIADDHAERSRGLMHRDRLAPGTGMLFVHADQERLAYWMKNTRIPLDILYFDKDRRLVSVSRAAPCSLGDRCPPHPSAGPALYVLEINAGEAESLGIAAGDTLAFGPGIPERGAP
jgi:uncharacterized membrane protein (UPF0127 family)